MGQSAKTKNSLKKFFIIIIRAPLKNFLQSFQRCQPNVGAFYTVSTGALWNQWRIWNTGLPGIKPYYAVKCNPEPILLKWMLSKGAGFDCASAKEMYLVKRIMDEERCLNEDKILFANPCKTPADISAGKVIGSQLVTADSSSEIEKMKSMNYKPNLLLRVSVDDVTATCPFGTKFGLEPSQVGEVAFKAKSAGFSVVGLSFHVGSGSKDTNSYKTAIKTCKDVWSKLKSNDLVKNMKILDLGGGWSYKEDEFMAAAKRVREALGEGEKVEQVIAEPGRFFAAPTHTLYIRVVGKKPLAPSGWRYTFDESIYGQFSCIPFDHMSPQIGRIRSVAEAKRPKTRALFFGRTCDSLDIIGKSIETEELEVGDWLVVPNMGAYTTATSSEFNGFPKPRLFETNMELENKDVNWFTNMDYPLANMMDVKKACEM